ncbi:MAG: conserved membrane protein of unknown function [Candidatus Thorarchaeota archaeon]|nr:MAG: conserved membrane protein of unknown function [Candidatus Thorarchaeota archaeon]
MFGKGLFKLIGLGIAIAISLLVGSNILNSIIVIVGEARNGNLVPLISIYVVTMIVVLIPRMLSIQSIADKIIRICAYAVIGYTSVLSFFVGLSFGFVLSLTFFILTVLIYSFVHDPSEILALLETKQYTQQLGRISNWSRSNSHFESKISEKLLQRHSVFIISHKDRMNTVELIRRRPFLPITLLHLVDCDVILINKEVDGNNQIPRILSLLKENKIDSIIIAPNLLSEAVLLMPILDERNGLSMSDYRIVSSSNAIDNLLEIWPERMIVIGHSDGLRVILPQTEVLGIESMSIKEGYESDVLLLHEYSSLREVSPNAHIA